MTKHKNTGNRSETRRPSGSTKARVKTAMASLAAAPAATRSYGPMPIVGVGASAGGLEALEQFFSKVPADCGMAFAVIQHLDPTHKGIMTELLQRSTRMTVMQAKNRMKVQPNHVYVIPPNKDMSLLRGTLHLFVPAAPRGLRLPIDFFLRSLADDRGEASIGVILSGMGSDGTLGARAIKEQAGVVLGVGTGESLNETPATGAEWPGAKERRLRLGEAIELMRRLWTEERVTFDGEYYRNLQSISVRVAPRVRIPKVVGRDVK